MSKNKTISKIARKIDKMDDGKLKDSIKKDLKEKKQETVTKQK